MTTTPPFSSPFPPAVLAPWAVFREQIGEVDPQLVRVSATDELLIDVLAEGAAIGSRMGVGVRRR